MNSYGQLVATAVVQLIIGGFVYGQLTQRVKDQGGWLKKHDGLLDKHGDMLIDHEGRISYFEGRKGQSHGSDR